MGGCPFTVIDVIYILGLVFVTITAASLFLLVFYRLAPNHTSRSITISVLGFAILGAALAAMSYHDLGPNAACM